ncbi:MAG: hypothetical protein V1934_07455 [Methanobacteriota archaeon]
MDPIFHLLFTNLYARDERWRDEALVFSVLPDLGFLLIELYLFFYVTASVNYADAMATVPQSLLVVYRLFHSLLVFGIVAAIVWRVRPRLLPALLAWLLHILVDIPVHEGTFTTRVLYPVLPGVQLQGWSWGTPAVVFSAYALLLALYAFSAWRDRRKHLAAEGWTPDVFDRLNARADALLRAKRLPILHAFRQNHGKAPRRLSGEDSESPLEN